MKNIVTNFHDNNPYDLANQLFFLAQILIGMTLMQSQSFDTCERILSYVLQA